MRWPVLPPALTPVPWGVGPMTVTMLLVNTVLAWCHQHGIAHGLDDLIAEFINVASMALPHTSASG